MVQFDSFRGCCPVFSTPFIEEAGLVLMNSFSFCLSRKLDISLSILKTLCTFLLCLACNCCGHAGIGPQFTCLWGLPMTSVGTLAGGLVPGLAVQYPASTAAWALVWGFSSAWLAVRPCHNCCWQLLCDAGLLERRPHLGGTGASQGGAPFWGRVGVTLEVPRCHW